MHDVKRRRYILITPRRKAYAADRAYPERKCTLIARKKGIRHAKIKNDTKMQEKGSDATSIRHAKMGQMTRKM